GWPGAVVLVIRLLVALVWLLSGRGAVFTEPGLASCCSKFSSSVRALAALIDGLLLPAAVPALVLAEGRAYRSAVAAAGRAGCGWTPKPKRAAIKRFSACVSASATVAAPWAEGGAGVVPGAAGRLMLSTCSGLPEEVLASG